MANVETNVHLPTIIYDWSPHEFNKAQTALAAFLLGFVAKAAYQTHMNRASYTLDLFRSLTMVDMFSEAFGDNFKPPGNIESVTCRLLMGMRGIELFFVYEDGGRTYRENVIILTTVGQIYSLQGICVAGVLDIDTTILNALPPDHEYSPSNLMQTCLMVQYILKFGTEAASSDTSNFDL